MRSARLAGSSAWIGAAPAKTAADTAHQRKWSLAASASAALPIGSAKALLLPLLALLCHSVGQSKAEIVQIRRDEQLLQLWSAEKACASAKAQTTLNDYGGVQCPTQWDTIGCWPATEAGSTRFIPCPRYINLFDTEAVTSTRVCLNNGSWEQSPGKNSTMILTERYHPCFGNPWEFEGALEVPAAIQNHLPNVLLIYDIGYSVSLVALILAIVLMTIMRKLRCPRNTIHVHLFASYIARAIMTLLSSHLLASQSVLNTNTVLLEGQTYFSPNASHWECKMLTAVTHYASGANFMWIFMEGLYLHMLIFATSFTDKSSAKRFIIGGWLGPLLYVIPYVIVRVYVDDHECWSNYSNRSLRWIVEGPMALTIIVNFVLFLNIIRVLVTKLRAPHAREDNANIHRKLAKSTLVLIPLFGVHWIVFLALDVHMDVGAEIARFYFDTLLTSFQGFAVSLLFCFCNSEVQAEIKKKWQQANCVSKKLLAKKSLGIGGTAKVSRGSVPTESTLLRDSRRNTPVGGAGGGDGSTPDEQRSPADELQHLVMFVEDEPSREMRSKF